MHGALAHAGCVPGAGHTKMSGWGSRSGEGTHRWSLPALPYRGWGWRAGAATGWPGALGTKLQGLTAGVHEIEQNPKAVESKELFFTCYKQGDREIAVKALALHSVSAGNFDSVYWGWGWGARPGSSCQHASAHILRSKNGPSAPIGGDRSSIMNESSPRTALVGGFCRFSDQPGSNWLTWGLSGETSRWASPFILFFLSQS